MTLCLSEKACRSIQLCTIDLIAWGILYKNLALIINIKCHYLDYFGYYKGAINLLYICFIVPGVMKNLNQYVSFKMCIL